MLHKPGRGRPRKFGRSAKSVTLTLPHDVIERLGAMNTDLGRAIVSLVERTPGKPRRTRPPAEVATYGNRSVILVTPVRALTKLLGVQLVPVRAQVLPGLSVRFGDAVLRRDV